MKKILYLHGFSSAGSTGTAVMLRNYLFADYGVSVLSPDIPVMPADGLVFLKKYAEAETPDLIIGTSMGAMYAELLRGFTRICVNPSFQMSRLLTFNHLGKNVEFKNKRADGATTFKVDKAMVAEFKEIEKTLSLRNITAEEKARVWGLFRKNDKVVNCRDMFIKAYGKAHYREIEGEHNLTQVMVKRDVLPLILELLGV
jgi:predicted esterase YcpF (UPF0227 family)